MSENERERLLTFDLLKCFVAFLVISSHFASNSIFPQGISRLSVPVFMVISFYFLSRNIDRGLDLKKRMLTLIIPLPVWSVIYTVIYILVLSRDIGLRDFFWQSVTGHSEVLNPSMWFQSTLIILTLLFVALSKWNKANTIILPLGIVLLSYALQYSGINDAVFKDLAYEVKYPLRRVCEMLPFMVLGWLLYRCDYFAKSRKPLYLIPSIVVLAYYLYSDLSLEPNDYQFHGASMFLATLALITCFTFVPFEKIPNKYQALLRWLPKYTLGIYCCHRLVEAFLHPFIQSMGQTERTGASVMIFVVSYLVCWAISKLPIALSRKIV